MPSYLAASKFMGTIKSKQSSREATAVIQARDGGRPARVEAEEAVGSNEILKVEPTGFTDGADLGCGRGGEASKWALMSGIEHLEVRSPGS